MNKEKQLMDEIMKPPTTGLHGSGSSSGGTIEDLIEYPLKVRFGMSDPQIQPVVSKLKSDGYVVAGLTWSTNCYVVIAKKE